jgi:transcription elongation GreA/GreB family factor
VRATLDGSWSHLREYYPPSAVVPDVLEAMEAWQRLASDGGPAEAVGAAKSLLSRMRTLLAANKFEALAGTVQEMSRDAAGRLRHTIQVHPALPAAFRAQADRAITLTRRDLEQPAAKSAEDEAHYCTARAYSEKLAELRLITSTKIPKNSKVIEEARMEGDLRENAGYQYAKEEQKMLVQQQASLSDLLSRAQVVHAREIDPATICFGTQFRVRNLKSDEEETYTVLGRWEANPERHILSMQAPLARQFMGHRAGDSLTIDHPGGGQTPYEILAVENALELGEWDKAPEGQGA